MTIESLQAENAKLKETMRIASRWLDNIKYDLEASVYTLEDDEFETVFAARDILDEALNGKPIYLT